MSETVPVRISIEVTPAGEIRVQFDVEDGPSIRMTQTVTESVDMANLILERAKKETP